MQSKNHSTPISHTFRKRAGTGGVKGHLYETKLLTLILHRLLNDDTIEEFVLGTNIDGLGAMDDIVLRYKKKQSQKSKVIFLQAKHRDVPNKNKLTINEILKEDGDFSFRKYFESYLKIKQILSNENNNVMFRGPSNDIDVEFIIYTTANQNITKNKLTKALAFESVIKTVESIFQLKCDDQEVEDLLKSFRNVEVSLLAKSVAAFIKKKNYTKVMDNSIIKENHIFLSLNVISEDEKNTKSSSYYTGKFSDYFLNSKVDYLILMKEVLRNELRDAKNEVGQQEVDILETCRFKLPIDFGNRNFSFNGSEKQQAESLNDMCQIFRSLISSYEPDSEIKLDDNSIGPEKVIKREWLGEHWLGGLVGNLLTNDGETEILKFNLKEESLSPDNLNILRNLNQHYDLSKFRFNINIDGFPKINLFSTRHAPELVNFLGILKFYTNQAQEHKVEEIIKNEMKFRYLQDNSHFRTKIDLIYLMVHDKIQKWWKKPGKKIPYLTETCNYYKQAEQELKENPLIHFISLPFQERLKNMPIEFNSEAISSLSLDKFLKSHKKVLVILSDEIIFSSRKVIHYFDNIMTLHDCICLHLDSIIIKDSLDTLKQDLIHATNHVLILTVQDRNNITNHCKTMEQFITLFNGQIIIIADSDFEWDMMAMTEVPDIHNDSRNNFTDFSSKTRNIILKSKVIFQGVDVTIDTVFSNESLDILSTKLLQQIINSRCIELGKSLKNDVYCKTTDFFIDRNLCRYITLSIGDHKDTFWYLEEEKTKCMLPQKGNQQQKENDIIINTDSESMFQKTCESNQKSNVHWFERRDGHENLIWKKTRGSIHNLIKQVKSDLHKEFMLDTKTLSNIQEKIVIISSGPGTGKSTLLNHLAMETKRQHPNLWIINVNLLDNINQLSNWKDKKATIDLLEAFKFLCSLTIENKTTKHLKNGDNSDMKINEDEEFLKSFSVNGDQICFTNLEKKSLGVDLSERKLLIHFYNNNSLAVLVDGFDEICPDYGNEVKKLLCTLKQSKIAHMWLASRPCNMLTQLQIALETFPFSLSSLTSMEQETVLDNIWSKKFAPPESLSTFSVHQYYDIWIDSVRIPEDFTSIPLHLYMVSKVFEDYYMAYLNNTSNEDTFNDATNLTTLYEKFLNIKITEIILGEKKPNTDLKTPHMRQIRDREIKLFVENHKKSAAYYLLNKRLVLSEYDIKDVRVFLNNIKLNEELTDIIKCTIDNRPKFVHYTFAEYFACEHIFDKLISLDIKCVAYFLNHMLKKDKYVGIRRFINSKLQRNKEIVAALESTGPFRSMVFKTLYAQNVSSTKTALSVTMNENLETIIEFLLSSAQSLINVGNLSDFLKTIQNKPNCAICTAIRNMKKTTVLNFVKLVSNIDSNKLKDLLYCLTTMKRGSFKLVDDMRDVILFVLQQGNLDPRLLVAILTSRFQYSNDTPAHWLALDTLEFQFIWDSLPHLTKKQLFKIFSVRDTKGKTPLHYAALKNEYSFFGKIYELLGQKYFKKLCLMKSNSQYITVCAFSYDEKYFGKLKTLLEKIYEERDIDVKDFVLKKLSKLHPRDLSRIPRTSFLGTRGKPDSSKEFEYFIQDYDCMEPIYDWPHKRNISVLPISVHAYKSN